jgi:16S rRNA (uracil1498-N3)-methyltransferase
MSSGAGPPTGPLPGPDATLVSAAAMVFVTDPAAPILTQGDAHHLFDVLRLRPGEVVITGDGNGGWSPCRVAPGISSRGWRQVDPASLLAPDGPVVRQPRVAPEITVAFAPTKGDRPEWVVQKLTELGVDRIVPIWTVRSVVRWEGAERGQRATDKLSRVAREAAAQCRRTWLPEVGPVTTLDDLAAVCGSAPRLACPGGVSPTLDHPVVAVGPEGGWDPDELARFGVGVGLGPNVLRAETAAVAVGTLLCALRGGVVAPLA